MNNFNYGENLRIIRQAKGVSQESMAWNLTISQASYSRLENGKIMPNPQQIAMINKILGIPPSELMPHLEELEHDTLVSTHGSGLGRQAAALLGKPAIFFVKTGLALTLGGVGYDAARGACSALETSANSSSFASWIAALSMVAYFYYWAGRSKKLS